VRSIIRQSDGTLVFNIGTIGGRHAIPTRFYMVDRVSRRGQTAYDEVYAATIAFVDDVCKQALVTELHFNIYYTGLTEATIACIDALENKRVTYTLMRYIKDTESYEPIRRNRL
jgi:hypothetical protein